MSRLLIFISIIFTCIKVSSQIKREEKIKVDSLFSIGELKNNIVFLDNLLIKDPNNDDLLFYKSRAYFDNRQYKLCLEVCKKFFKSKRPDDLRQKMLYIRGTSYYELEKFDLALKDYLETLKSGENELVLINTAYIYYFKKKYNKCIEYSSKIFELESASQPYIIRAYEVLGDCYMISPTPDTAKAIVTFKKLCEIDVENAFGREYLCRVYLSKDEFESSIEYGSQALQIDSTLHSSLLNRGFAYYNLKEYEKCLNDLYKFEQLGGVYDDLYNTMGEAYDRLNQKDSAVKYYLRYLKVNPKSSYYQNELAWAYYLLEDYSNCIKHATKSIKANKKNEDAYDTRACAWYKKKEYAKAINDFNKALAIFPNLKNSLYYRGLSNFHLNKKLEACKDWSKLIDTDYQIIQGEIDVKELVKANCN